MMKSSLTARVFETEVFSVQFTSFAGAVAVFKHVLGQESLGGDQ
jgi:hypothetical protein